MRGVRRAAGVAAVTAALVVGGVGPAAADSATIKDKRGDAFVGSAQGGKTAAERSFARQTDVTSATFTVGRTYVSLKVRFANLRPGPSYVVLTDIIQRKRNGAASLKGTFSPAGSNALATSPFSSNYTCGDPSQPGIPAGVPPIATTVRYGKNGYFKAQMPFGCMEAFGVDPSAKVKGRTPTWKANVIVQASVPNLAAGLTDWVSSTRPDKAKWSTYIKAG